jgi:microsomal epoxide hydrolase
VDRAALLTNVMLYWRTGTARSSARYHKEGTETWGEPEPPSPVPTAVAVFPHDIAIPVKRLAERNHNIVRWTAPACVPRRVAAQRRRSLEPRQPVACPA